MGLIKNWTFATNTAPLDSSTVTQNARSFLMQLKEFLVNSGGWTVVSSSDGTTFSSVSDLWGTNLTKVNWNTSAAARSHITLKSPEGLVAGVDGSWLGDQSRYWLTIDAVSSTSGTTYNWNCFLHRVAPTGGSTTARPTSTTEQSVTAGTYVQFIHTTNLSFKFHFGVVSSGENVGGVLKGKGAFYALITDYTASAFCSLLTVTPSTSVQKVVILDYPYSSALNFSYSGSSYLDANVFFNSGVRGWAHDGVATTFGCLALRGLMHGAGAGFIGYNSGISGDINSQNPNSDLWLYNPNSGKVFTVCKLADFLITGGAFANFTADASGTLYHASIQLNSGGSNGSWWFPTSTAFTF